MMLEHSHHRTPLKAPASPRTGQHATRCSICESCASCTILTLLLRLGECSFPSLPVQQGVFDQGSSTTRCSPPFTPRLPYPTLSILSGPTQAARQDGRKCVLIGSRQPPESSSGVLPKRVLLHRFHLTAATACTNAHPLKPFSGPVRHTKIFESSHWSAASAVHTTNKAM